MSGRAHLVLIGAMGAGKTTVGRELAYRLGRAFVDSDDLIAGATGMTSAEMAAANGVAALHDLEHDVVERSLSVSTPCVIAAAASVVDSDSLRTQLAEHRCVWLTAGVERLTQRRSEGTHRRQVRPTESPSMELRPDRYAQLAEVTVDTGIVGVDQAVAIILSQLERSR